MVPSIGYLLPEAEVLCETLLKVHFVGCAKRYLKADTLLYGFGPLPNSIAF